MAVAWIKLHRVPGGWAFEAIERQRRGESGL